MRNLAILSAAILASAAWVLLDDGVARADRVLFDFEPPYLHQPGYTVKDHDVVYFGGLWHAFYIRGIEGVPGTSSETQLGHATSSNLRSWIILPPVLDAGPEAWDTNRVWAPDIRQVGGEWSMYYTGVDEDFLQRMGGATSTNLDDWSKLVGNPVAEPDSTIYLWSPDLDVPELSAFRDPFQFEYQGDLHLLHTALIPDSTVAAGRRGVIHHLVEDGAGGWTDAGPLAVNNNTAIGAWRELESLQLIEHDGRWHLFFTYFGIGGVYWTSSEQLESGWDVASAVYIDRGVGAEVTPIGNGSYLFTRHGSATHSPSHPEAGQVYFVLRADTLRFNPVPDPPTIIPENSFAQRWPTQQGAAFLASPTFGDNARERGQVAINHMGNGYLSSIDLYDGPFGDFGSPGAEAGAVATGMIQSEWFFLGPKDSLMTLLVAGPDDPHCAVRLVERISPDGEPLETAVLDSARGDGIPRFSQRNWDVSAWRGRQVRLEVTDFSPTGWIAVDHIRMFTEDPFKTAAPSAAPAPIARLLPNRPNPFNPRTELRFELTRAAVCEIALFDLRGRSLRRLELGAKSAGQHSMTLDGSGLASGTYLVQLVADDRPVSHQKISLIR